MAAHSQWHRCKRWRRKGFECPMGVRHREAESEEDAEPVPSGNRQSAAARMVSLVRVGASMVPLERDRALAMAMGEEATAGAMADALAPRGPGLKVIGAVATAELLRRHMKGRRFTPTMIKRVGGFAGMGHFTQVALRMEDLQGRGLRSLK